MNPSNDPATALIHAVAAAAPSRSLATPIYQSASFRLDDLATAAELYGPTASGESATYSRYGNPTVAVLEARAVALEGGVGALATASGMSAILLAILNLVDAGTNVVCQSEVYGSTRSLLTHSLGRLGIEVRFVPGGDPAAFAAAIDGNTRLVYAETIANPSLRVVDLGALAAVAGRAGIPLIIDNTAAPMLCRPLDHGASVVVHSATKYIGGHGSSLGGIVIDGGTFDWTRDPERFAALVGPDPSYQGVSWTGVHGSSAYIVRLRRTLMRDFGPALSPLNAVELIRGFETLSVRMARISSTASEVARRLNEHPAVLEVRYPSGETAERMLPAGKGGLIGLRVAGGLSGARHLIQSLALIAHVVNIGDVRTLVTWPAGTTHGQLLPAERLAADIPDDLLRLSIGLEAADDIVGDLIGGLDTLAQKEGTR